VTEVPERPRDRIYSYAIDRMSSLAVHASLACREPTCGARDEEGDLISCQSVHCGEKLMLSGYRRELTVMRDIRALIEALERAELERLAAGDKRGKR